MTMIVEDSHFAYLRLQKGSLDHLAGDRAAWLAAYERSLHEDFASLAPHLPARCASLLDVGSGLGGIDVLLDRHYGGDVAIRLLDGEADPPEMIRHNRTFNDMRVAEDFQRKNGVRDAIGWSPKISGDRVSINVDRSARASVDLAISLGSWCFHYPPSLYVDFVACLMRTGGVVILDVRTDKPHWREELRQTFKEVACAKVARKFNRLVFHAK